MSQTINVDITPNNFQPTLNYSQGDVGRTFSIKIVSQFGDTLPSGATVKIQATKPSGFGFDVTADSVTDNVATFTTTAEMTDEWGRFPAQLDVTKDAVTIFSAKFLMVGAKNTHPEGTTDGSQGTIIPELTLLVERVEAAASSVLDMEVEAQTLPAGSLATYSYDEDENKATFGIPQGEAGAGAAGVTASAYSASKTYAVGEYVIHNNNLYRCTTAITTAEAFTAAHWTQVVLGDDVTDLKSEISKNVHPSMNANRYVNINGVIGSNSAFALSDALLIEDILKITRIYSGFAKDYCIAYYDASNTFLSIQNVANVAGQAQWVKINPPTDAVYLRFNTLVGTVSADGVLVEYSIDASVYEGKVESDAEKALRVESVSMARDTFINTSGNVGRNTLFAISDFLPTKNIISVYGGLTYDYPVIFYDADKTMIGYQNDDLVMAATARWYNIEAPQNAVYLKFNTLIDTVPASGCKVKIKYDLDYIESKIDYLDNSGADVAMFENIAVCGDSFTRCDMYIENTGVQSYESSWGKVIERMRNISVNVYAKGGATIKSYLTDPLCLPKLLSESASQLYVLCIGLNDYATTIGTVDDIKPDYTQNPDTFFGNYGRLIDQIKSHAPNAKIIICRTFLVGSIFYLHTADAISEIAEHYAIPMIDTADSRYLTSEEYRGKLVNGHPTSATQSGMAKEMLKLIGKSIDDNFDYFSNFYIAD